MVFQRPRRDGCNSCASIVCVRVTGAIRGALRFRCTTLTKVRSRRPSFPASFIVSYVLVYCSSEQSHKFIRVIARYSFWYACVWWER